MCTWKLYLAVGLLLSGMALEAKTQGLGSFAEVNQAGSRWGAAEGMARRVPDTMPTAVLEIQRRLAMLPAQRVAAECNLAELARQLRELGIPSVLDEPSLEDNNVLEASVRVGFPTMTLASGLAIGLGRLRCGWIPSKDGATIVITTQGAMEERLMTVTYDVSQIVGQSDYGTLHQVITSTIAADSWEQVGGPGTVQAMPMGTRDLLVVSAGFHVHMELRQLLDSIASMGVSPATGSQRTRSTELRLPGRTRDSNSMRSGVLGSTVIEMPGTSKKRGMALPNSQGDGATSAFGGGMMGGLGGGMF